MTLATDKTKVSSYMDGELVRQIRVLAAMEGHSVSSYLESLAKGEVERARVKGVRFDLLKDATPGGRPKGATPGGRPMKDFLPPAMPPENIPRSLDPHSPPPTTEEM